MIWVCFALTGPGPPNGVEHDSFIYLFFLFPKAFQSQMWGHMFDSWSLADSGSRKETEIPSTRANPHDLKISKMEKEKEHGAAMSKSLFMQQPHWNADWKLHRKECQWTPISWSNIMGSKFLYKYDRLTMLYRKQLVNILVLTCGLGGLLTFFILYDLFYLL